MKHILLYREPGAEGTSSSEALKPTPPEAKTNSLKSLGVELNATKLGSNTETVKNLKEFLQEKVADETTKEITAVIDSIGADEKTFDEKLENTMTVEHVTTFLTKIKTDIESSSYKDVYSKFRKAATMSVQMGLKIMGYSIGATEVDGQRGPATRKAIQQFQALNGLTPDGFAGKDTIGKMLDVGVKKSATALDFAAADVKIAEYDKTKVNAGKVEPEGIANNTEKKGPGVDKKNDVDATTTVKTVDIPKENTKKVDVASNDQISENIFKAIDQGALKAKIQKYIDAHNEHNNNFKGFNSVLLYPRRNNDGSMTYMIGSPYNINIKKGIGRLTKADVMFENNPNAIDVDRIANRIGEALKMDHQQWLQGIESAKNKAAVERKIQAQNTKDKKEFSAINGKKYSLSDIFGVDGSNDYRVTNFFKDKADAGYFTTKFYGWGDNETFRYEIKGNAWFKEPEYFYNIPVSKKDVLSNGSFDEAKWKSILQKYLTKIAIDHYA